MEDHVQRQQRISDAADQYLAGEIDSDEWRRIHEENSTDYAAAIKYLVEEQRRLARHGLKQHHVVGYPLMLLVGFVIRVIDMHNSHKPTDWGVWLVFMTCLWILWVGFTWEGKE